jgi:ubiquinone/menaquinone biosynthesis C-methylase UbiE
MSAPQPAINHPSYGLDAPGVVSKLFMVTGVAVAVGLLGMTLEFVLWANSPEPFRIIFPLYLMGPWVAIACGVTGLAMVWYSYFGKLRMRDRLLDRVAWRGDEQVLDVGCGRGLMLIGAAGRLTTGKATGIDLWQDEDLSGNSAQRTIANAQTAGVADRVDVKTGDASEMPFPDGSFDVILSTMALHNIYDAKQRERAVREVARVLKPGGRVVIADIQHTGQYAEILDQCGLTEVGRHQDATAVPITLMTWGAVRPATVTARKPPAAA